MRPGHPGWGHGPVARADGLDPGDGVLVGVAVDGGSPHTSQ